MDRRRVLITAAAVMILAGQTAAEGHEPVLLTVTTPSGTTQFTMSDLEAMGLETIETSTLWTEGVQRFEGVSLKALVDRFGLEDGEFRAYAINDYAVAIPVSDAVDGGPILAFRQNGEVMSVRDKGPIWLVYPYDDNAEYRSEVIYSRSIWQLDRFEIRP